MHPYIMEDKQKLQDILRTKCNVSVSANNLPHFISSMCQCDSCVIYRAFVHDLEEKKKKASSTFMGFFKKN